MYKNREESSMAASYMQGRSVWMQICCVELIFYFNLLELIHAARRA